MKKYYVSANTAEGFIDELEENLYDIDTVITLRHTITINSAIIRGIIKENKKESSIEILKSPLADNHVDGVILRDKRIAIVSERFRPTETFEKAYQAFSKGLAIHDKLEDIYIQEMDFKKADKIADNLIEHLLGDIPKENRKSTIIHRFFGTNTMDGVVNEVPHITNVLDHVYHIKGRAGTGKSTFMKRVAYACMAHGLDMEWYRCSFDPSSIDMVLIPKLNTCLFDSTDPHAFKPKDPEREKIIDLYELAVTPGTDEKYKKSIEKWTTAYKRYMKQGLEILKEAGEELLERENTVSFTKDVENEIHLIQTIIAGR